MKQIKIIVCAFFVSLVIGPIASLASEQVIDGPIARNQIKANVQSMFYQERFDELEKMAQEFRKSKARLPEGVWKLQFFYEGLGTTDHSPEGWKKFFSIIDKWFLQSPDSITARVVAAGALIDIGGEARGKGSADTVSDDGWRVFAASNEKAFNLLGTSPTEGMDDCPQRYYYLLTIARSQGWERPKFEALFHDAVSFEPTYYSFYIIKAKYLLPRWYGEEGEWQQFAKDAVGLTPESEGKTAYMRIVGSLLMSVDIATPSDPRLSWPLLKQGYLDVERNFPEGAKGTFLRTLLTRLFDIVGKRFKNVPIDVPKGSVVTYGLWFHSRHYIEAISSSTEDFFVFPDDKFFSASPTRIRNACRWTVRYTSLSRSYSCFGIFTKSLTAV